MLKPQTFLSFLILTMIFIMTACGRSQVSEVKKVKINGAEIAYYTRGSGEPLVMIMGFRGTMSGWDPGLLEELEKKFTLIIFDNRGVGFSSDTDENHTTIAEMAYDTISLIKELGYQKAHILGWSMGSSIALKIAFHNPEIVRTLILCAPNPGGNFQAQQTSSDYSKLVSSEVSQEELLSLIFPRTSTGIAATAGYIARLTKAIVEGSIPNDLQVSAQTIERQAKALQQWSEDPRHYGELSNVKVPTLVAGALSDAIDPVENARMIACRIPFAWSAYYADAGHAFLFQNYKNFADLVTLFIDSNQ